MTKEHEVVFWLDVDNTLLDNDRFTADLGERLELDFGAEQRARYFEIFKEVRSEFGYADYLRSLQKFRLGLEEDPRLLLMSQFMLEYPFAERVYPRALDAIAHLRTLGRPLILSDGDMVFQPRKIQRSGLWQGVEGHVLIYVHKELMLASIERRYRAAHYVMVDDKPTLLKAMKKLLGSRLTTVLVRQGHYATDAAVAESAVEGPLPDLTLAGVGDLCNLNLADLLATAPAIRH
jgi:FMN phosphatase YigB (HAD superfamily)